MTLWITDGGARLFHADALDFLRDQEDDSFAAIITDPPYNVGKDYGDGHDDSLAPDAYEAWLREVLTECARVSSDAVVFTPGTANVFMAAWVAEDAGLRVHRQLGWHKREYAGDKWTGGPAMCWEPVLWCSTQDKPYFTKTFGAWGRDFLVVPATHGDPYHGPHPCPKPMPVMKWLVGLFVPENGEVLDPFCGTGTTLLAAREAGRRSVGVDRNEDYLRLASQRLSQLTLEAV